MSEGNPFAIGEQVLSLETHEQSIRNRLGHMDSSDFTSRFWRKDARLWRREANDPSVTGAMGWLTVARVMRDALGDLETFARNVGSDGFERAVLCGMGGSSLAPLVFSRTLCQPGVGLPVSILDTTDPETVLRIERGGDLSRTLFIIASKSGTTAEPAAFDDYFYEAVGRRSSIPGQNFVAITDPGTALDKSARARGFRRVFLNFADIGGRFSALSFFGMVPAAVMGLDLAKLLDRAIGTVEENNNRPASASPAFVLGAALGDLANKGVDKVTFLVSDELKCLGLWLEQLIAESTGKEGKGILPVACEMAGAPSEYGEDRVFAYFHSGDGDQTWLGSHVAALRDADRPVVQICVDDHSDVGREMMRWEIATAVAGSIIGINPFDQPNVQESKDVTKQIIAEVEHLGRLPEEAFTLEADGLCFYGPVSGQTVEEAVFSFLGQAHPGDFITLMAYLTETEHVTEEIENLQCHIRDCTCLATTQGYGPRFLHSTGQYHKGGPNKGHFIQLTKDDAEDTPLPGRSYTFGTFRNAQALGDRQTLEKHGRHVIRVHLGKDVLGGLRKLVRAVESRPTVAL